MKRLVLIPLEGYNGNRYGIVVVVVVVSLINERQEDLSRRIFECTRTPDYDPGLMKPLTKVLANSVSENDSYL